MTGVGIEVGVAVGGTLVKVSVGEGVADGGTGVGVAVSGRVVRALVGEGVADGGTGLGGIVAVAGDVTVGGATAFGSLGGGDTGVCFVSVVISVTNVVTPSSLRPG